MAESETITPTIILKDGKRALNKSEEKELGALVKRLEKNLQNTVQNLVQIGVDLKKAKELVGHGGFQNWLKENFELSDQTARRFMHVADVFGDHPDSVKQLSLSSVYLLAAPSTPDTIREKVINLLESGKTVSLQQIQSLRQENGTGGAPPDADLVTDSGFRHELRKVNKKLKSWTTQVQKDWQGINGTINKKSRTELETLHQDLAQFTELLAKMLAEAKDAPKLKRKSTQAEQPKPEKEKKANGKTVRRPTEK